MKKTGIGIGIMGLFVAMQSQAALVLDLGSGTEPTAAGSITITNVDVTADSSIDSIATVGTLSSANDLGNLSVVVEAANVGAWSLDGANNLTITTTNVIAPNADGWGVIGGGFRTDGGGQLGAFTFDLSSLNLGVGESLRLTSFSTDVTATNSVGYIVDGSSFSGLEPDSAGGTVYTVNTTITDGQRIAFSGNGASAAFRLAELNLQVVPEPATIGLLN